MWKPEIVEEVLTRLRQGESVQRLAREFGIDRKTIRAWRAKGRYQPRIRRARRSILDPHAAWLTARAPEVGFNSVVLQRELVTHFGYTGSRQQVVRFVRPLRVAARVRATVRFETAPGQQAQVDFGQCRVWIGDAATVAHVFVCTLGYSRRQYPEAFPHERLSAVLAGHEHAFQHFGGVPAQLVVDNAKPVVLRHLREGEDERRHQVIWHPVYADFAAYYGFTPWAHWPYRPQTKGKVESGVKYVQRNALAGKRFRSWEHLNAWLLEWATTIADQRVHGTTHAIPAARFAEEGLSPLGLRRVYSRERVGHRVVALDSLVSIGGSRYSVPARYAGSRVVIRELLGSYEILHDGVVIARHAAAGRHQVVMDPAHYHGLLRPRGAPPTSGPPRFDPGYPASTDVAVRDLGVYAALVEEGVA